MIFGAPGSRGVWETGRPVSVVPTCTRRAKNITRSGAGARFCNNVWLGGGVIVCPGVTIGDDCVIGAGAVVTTDIPAGAIAVGNPARVTGSVYDKKGE